MIPNTIVEKDTSGLEMVLEALKNLLEERFIEGIRSKRRSLYEIGQMAELVQMYQHRVNIEAKAVSKFSENFIRSFATTNNKCFDTASVLFGKIRSTIKGLKDVFHKTTPIDRRRLPEGVEAPSVFDKSPLGHGEYTPDAFGLESFPKEVQDLYHAIDTLFSTSTAVLALCHLMIEEEAKTRNDIVQLRQIYKESCDELLGAVKAASAFIVSTEELPENELEERRKKAGLDTDKFLREGYHSVHKDVLTQYLVIKTIREARSKGLTDIEAFFWRDCPDKVMKVREVIEKFDKIKDVKGQGNSLSSMVLVEFLKWCGVSESKETQLYKQYFIPNYSAKGKLKPLGWNTISGKRKEMKELGDSDEKLANDFEKRLSDSSSSEEGNAVKITDSNKPALKNAIGF